MCLLIWVMLRRHGQHALIFYRKIVKLIFCAYHNRVDRSGCLVHLLIFRGYYGFHGGTIFVPNAPQKPKQKCLIPKKRKKKLLTGLDPWGEVCVCQFWQRWGPRVYVPRYCLHHCCTVCAPAETSKLNLSILRMKGTDTAINTWLFQVLVKLHAAKKYINKITFSLNYTNKIHILIRVPVTYHT